MSYLVFARKYRPKRFEDVVGQEAISTTLRNSITANRVHHAYLFAGPRGVGKTSLARIFARTLIVGDRTDASPEAQARAKEIEEGRFLDVMEIDGASNRGIDDVRAIRESVRFAPAYGPYKIYIIDEVHQITPDAFNALLKTLEEPPSHVKFIFATTVPQKVPATILSRCQRFDFRRISTELIAQTLKKIALAEKITAADEALFEVARAADGSMRDAESLLDQVVAFKNQDIQAADVAQALGLASQEDIAGLFDFVSAGDGASLVRAVNTTLLQGRDEAHLIEKCLEHTRNLLLVRTGGGAAELVEGSKAYRERLTRQAQGFAKADLFYIFAVLNQGAQNLRRFHLKRIALEMALLKAAWREPMVLWKGDETVTPPPPKTPLPAPFVAPGRPERATSTELNLGAGRRGPAPSAETPSVVEVLEPRPAAQTDLSSDGDDAEDPVPPPQENLERLWPRFVERVRTEKMSAATYLAQAKPVGWNGSGSAVIAFREEHTFHAEALQTEENLKLLEKILTDLLARPAKVTIQIEADGASSKPAISQEPSATVKSALNILGGRIVKK